MDQAARSPILPSTRLQSISRLEPGPRSSLYRVGPWSCPNRNGEPLLAVPEAARTTLLAGLRARIHAIERHSSFHTPLELSAERLRPQGQSASRLWTLGAPEIDQRFAGGLDVAAVHEVKPGRREAGVTAGDWVTALGFALRLAVRRLAQVRAQPSGSSAQILWCWPASLARELGAPYGPGLAALGLEPSSCLLVETVRVADALWAMEEGLKSGSVAAVIGVLKDVELTPARRLSLAAAAHRTPCVLVTDPRSGAAGATATRWRSDGRTSAAHPFETSAPGASRRAVSLEHCRQSSVTPQASSLVVEWSNDTHRFRVAPALAHRTHAPRSTGRGA